MKNKFFFLFIYSLLLIGCKSKSVISTSDNNNNNNNVVEANYLKAKDYLKAAEYDKAIKAIEDAINQNETVHLEELYFLKGFILHAYGDITDARLAYQKVIDMEESYSSFRKKAIQLLDLSIAEEVWEKELSDIKPETFTKKEINEMDAQTLPFKIPEQLPRFKSCPEGSNAEVKACTNQKIHKHIARNYDVNIGNTFGVYQKVRSYTLFTIDKNGNPVHIRARSSNKFLSLEAKRTIFTLPKLIPGLLDGKNVEIQFTIPITYSPTY